MAKKDKTDIPVEDVKAFVEEQIRVMQVSWMEHTHSGNTALAAQDAAVLDKLHTFANMFWDEPVPAPGQGYEPPEAVWQEILKQRRLEEIDQQMAELQRRRAAVLNGEEGETP